MQGGTGSKTRGDPSEKCDEKRVAHGQGYGLTNGRKLCVFRLDGVFGIDNKLKTEASKRDIDLDPRLPYRIVQFIRAHKIEPGQFLFQSECGDVANLETIRRRLRLRKVLGWHSFRRFRLTHLRKARVSEDILRWWMGHSSKDISDRYSKLAEDLEFRKHWAKAADLGFSIEYLSHPIRRLKRRSRLERYNAMLKADVKPAPYQATDSDLPDCFQSTSVLSLGATNS